MDIRSVIKNISYLYIVRGVSLLSPLALIPHLLKVLGVQNFGELFFVQSIVLYFGLVIDFGFELYAPGIIATLTDKREISGFSSSVQTIKILIVCALFLLAGPFIFFLPSALNLNLLFVWFGVILAQSLIPIWFFQGIGNLSRLALYQSIMRVISVCLTIYFVREADDILIYPIVESLCFLVVSVLCWRTYFAMGYRLVRNSRHEILKVAKESLNLFFSKIAISLYTISGTFVLGLISGPTAVSLYAAPMKVIETLGNLMGPINQVVYPYISRSRVMGTLNTKLLSRYISLCFCASLILSFALFFSRSLIVTHYFKSNSEVMLTIFGVLAFVPCFVFMSNVLGIQLLLGHGFRKDFTKIITSCSVLGLVLIVSLTKLEKGVGTAAAILAIEAVIAAWMSLEVRKKILKES